MLRSARCSMMLVACVTLSCPDLVRAQTTTAATTTRFEPEPFAPFVRPTQFWLGWPKGAYFEADPTIPLFLASRTGMQIVPVGVGFCNPWRLRSWDRFAIPKPCTRAKMVSGRTFTIPANTRSEGLEGYRLLAQAELDRLTRIAEHWAATNRFDESTGQSV